MSSPNPTSEGIDDSDFTARLRFFSEECQRIFPAERIVLDAQKAYGTDTTLAVRTIPLGVQPISEEEISGIVVLANRFRIPLYTISTGHNWGYGTSNPVVDNCVIVDLSRMNQILEFNKELCWVRIEPGVTQQILYDFLSENKLDFMVPVTGAGPHASLIGNILERGFGINPLQDHFDSLLALRVVLPDGRVLLPSLFELAGGTVSNNHRWGVGPYLQGIFSQSNFGIITEATIALVRRPERIEAFTFSIKSRADFPRAIDAIREMKQTLGDILGGIYFMNDRRMLALNVPFPFGRVLPGEIIGDDLLKELRNEHEINVWTAVGGIFGTREIVSAARKTIKKHLQPFASQIMFVTPTQASALERASHIVPAFLGGAKLKRLSSRVYRIMGLLLGRPTHAGFPLAYWKLPGGYNPEENVDPAKDGCGLMWYSPLVPMNSELVEKYIAFIENTCAQFGIEPLITLTSISDKCFNSLIPIVFNTREPAEVARAKVCFQTLFMEGSKRGFFPYRLGVDQMPYLTSAANYSVFWDVVSNIKTAIDPNGILSPGRYCKMQ